MLTFSYSHIAMSKKYITIMLFIVLLAVVSIVKLLMWQPHRASLPLSIDNETSYPKVNKDVTQVSNSYKNQLVEIVNDVKGQYYSTFKANLNQYNFDIIAGGVSIENARMMIENRKERLIFATNGGLFEPDFRTCGLCIKKGKELQGLNIQTNIGGNFYMQPNGVFYIKDKKAHIETTKRYVQLAPKPDYAIQSGPMLLVNGEVNSLFKADSHNVNIRSGVGIDTDGNIYFVLSNDEVSFYDFAMFFKVKYQCTQALYLDGTISEMYIADKTKDISSRQFATVITLSEPLKQ